MLSVLLPCVQFRVQEDGEWVVPEICITVLAFSGDAALKVRPPPPLHGEGCVYVCSVCVCVCVWVGDNVAIPVQSICVLVQGVIVDQTNYTDLINTLRVEIRKYENALSKGNISILYSTTPTCSTH